MIDYHNIITPQAGKRSGKSCIRELRITVQDVLDWLASGMTTNDILANYPELTSDDVLACLSYASQRERHAALLHIAAQKFINLNLAYPTAQYAFQIYCVTRKKSSAHF